MTIKTFQTILSRPERNGDPLLEGVMRVAAIEDLGKASQDDDGNSLWTPWH